MADTLDQRATVYRYADQATDGFTAGQYQPLRQWWCRAQPVSANAEFVAAMRGQQVDATINFYDYTDVRRTDVVVVHAATGDEQYVIEGIQHLRLLRRYKCKASHSSHQVLPLADAPTAVIAGVPATAGIFLGTFGAEFSLDPVDTQGMTLPNKLAIITPPPSGQSIFIASWDQENYTVNVIGVSLGTDTFAVTVDSVTQQCTVTVSPHP